MPKRKISAKEIVQDIRTGMERDRLMEKYPLAIQVEGQGGRNGVGDQKRNECPEGQRSK